MWFIEQGMRFIELCNNNAGFISAILAAFTIVITIMIGRLPYKKKVSFYYYMVHNKRNGIDVFVYITNIGNCPIYADKLIAKDGFRKVISTSNDINMVDNRIIQPQKQYKFKITLDECTVENLSAKPLRIILKAGRRSFKYRANWEMG